MIESAMSARSWDQPDVREPPGRTACRLIQRNADVDGGASTGTRCNRERAGKVYDPLPNPDEPEGRFRSARSVSPRVEADTVVFDRIPDQSSVFPQPHRDMAGLRVFPDVVERLLNDSIDRGFDR